MTPVYLIQKIKYMSRWSETTSCKLEVVIYKINQHNNKEERTSLATETGVSQKDLQMDDTKEKEKKER